MLTVKTDKKENRFHGALQYIGEYRGIKAAAIIDSEGMVIDYWGKDDFDPEHFSPLTILMLDNINSVLRRLNERPANMVIIKNKDSWLTLHRISDVILAVNAEIETDDLLRVRISQAAEMVRSYLNDKYPLLVR